MRTRRSQQELFIDMMLRKNNDKEVEMIITELATVNFINKQMLKR